MAIVNIKTKEEFESAIRSNVTCLVHFFAPWAAQCASMNEVIEELGKQPEYQNVKLCKCEAEELPAISLQYKVAAVPTILLFSGGKVAETVNGANAADLTAKLSKIVGSGNGVAPVVAANGNQVSLEDRLKALTNKAPVVVFMKGNPQQPRCGFSKTLMAILQDTKVPFETFDILQDEDVRQGLKTFSNWPTYPQIYVKGELIGGLDIIQELKQSGELVSSLQGN